LTVDTEFEFFDPQKQDFHGIKRLLTQLFSSDAKLLDLSELTEIILDQPLLGSTVKIDGEGAQGDPYALFTVLNLGVHKVCNNSMYRKKLTMIADHICF